LQEIKNNIIKRWYFKEDFNKGSAINFLNCFNSKIYENQNSLIINDAIPKNKKQKNRLAKSNENEKSI
jgi:hypothetical protein